MFPSLSLLFREFRLSVKEKHDRKKIVPLIQDHETRYLII